MNKFVKFAAAAAVTTVMTAASASATTVGFAEGSRAYVPDVTVIDFDVQGMPALAYDVGTIGAGDVVNVFGAIGPNNFDSYAFTVTADAFLVSLIGDGLSRRGSSTPDTSAVVNLLDGATPYAILDNLLLTTLALPSSPILFSGGAGSYVIQIDGNGTAGAADYDLQIAGLQVQVPAAVPLPAAGLLLLAGLGAMGVAGRRRKMVAA